MASTHATNCCTVADADEAGALMYSCVTVISVRVTDQSGLRDDVEKLSSVQQKK